MIIAPLSYIKNFILLLQNNKTKINLEEMINLFTLKTSFAVAEPGLHKYRSKMEFVSGDSCALSYDFNSLYTCSYK